MEEYYFPEEPRYFETSVSSDCHFVVKGDFLIFYSQFIAPSMKLVSKRLGYLQERSEKAGNKLPEPMVIKFPESVFVGENWHENFLETMEKMKNLSINQLHANPYIHLSLLDYQDGSSFTVWIISEDEIYIIPQVRASVASMTRILAYIFEKIREGDMIQYVPSEAT
jgi:hypothetical protein